MYRFNVGANGVRPGADCREWCRFQQGRMPCALQKWYFCIFRIPKKVFLNYFGGNKMDIAFHSFSDIDDTSLRYAVIASRYDNEWLYVRHRDRSTWEIPGGKRAPGESIVNTAHRELFEETGCSDFNLRSVCVYSVHGNGVTSYGGLFVAILNELDSLPSYSEIVEVACFKQIPHNLTYPKIQPVLHEKAEEFLSFSLTGKDLSQ